MISDITCTPEKRNAGTIFTLSVSATDEDGDWLKYGWMADSGNFTSVTVGKEVKWKSPVTGAGQTFVITALVSDAEDEVSRQFQLQLGEPELGRVEGVVYFANFTIPIPEANVTVGDRQVITDGRGFFSIPAIPAGKYTLKAAKQEYSTYTALIEILPNNTLVTKAEMISVNHATKLSGIVADQDGQPLEYAEVVVLNPDGSESKLKSIASATGFYKLWYIPHGKMTIVARRASVDDFYFVEFNEKIDFQEIETQLDITLHKMSLNGEFTDVRDQHVYKYRTIGGETWMTENLSYLPRVSPSDKTSFMESFFYVYDYQGTNKDEARATENYQEYGVLYNYTAAMEICPSGWRLPYRSEWLALINPYGSLAGLKLKSKSGWSNHGNGDNATGFSAIPGGMIYKGMFSGKGDEAVFWSSTYAYSNVYDFVLFYDHDGVLASLTDEDNALSVRCVREK